MSAYRPILTTPGVRSLFVAGTLARLPVGFEALGIVLLVREATGSFTVAGIAVAAAFGVSAVCAAPLGRLVDRLGQRRVLMPVALGNAATLCVLATAGHLTNSSGTLIALSALTGVIPPISACQRTILATVFAGQSLRSVYALESIIQETVFTVGPLIATVVASLAGPPEALYVAAALQLGGTFWFVTTPLSRQWRTTDLDRRGRSAMGDPAVRVLALAAVLSAVSFGSFEVAVTALSRQEGRPNLAGLFTAFWAIGSAIGGIIVGARAHSDPAAVRMGKIGIICGLGFIPAAFAPNLWALAPLAAVAGLAIAPFLSLLYSLTGELAPEGMVTEAFAWLNVAFPIGFALGAAISGVVADGPGARAAIVIAGVGAGLAGFVAFRWRGTLAPRQAGRSLV